MPDTNPTDSQTLPTTAAPKKVSQKHSSGQDISQEPGNSSIRRVHAVMQGKGGVGKTYISTLIAQFLIETNQPVVCLDTDAVNATFRDFEALNVHPIDLFKSNGDEIDIDAMDAMVERFLTEDTNFVLDNGATSFVPLSRYIVRDGVADVLESVGRKLVIHTVIAGGQEQLQTVKGFNSLASQFPESVDIVLWLNEHHGPVAGVGGTPFETTPVFQKHKGRVRGIVRLPRLHQQTFAVNVADMLARNMTFAEADSSPSFYAMARSRLRQVKAPIFAQIGDAL
jgi:hypothetical protein